MCESVELDLEHLGGLRCRVTIRDHDGRLFTAYRLLDPFGLPIRIKDQQFYERQWEAFCSEVRALRKPSLPPGWDFIR